MSMNYKKNETAVVLVDPYNEVLCDGGKVWPRLKEVAESVNLHDNIKQILDAARRTGIKIFIAPHRRWRPGDVEGWLHPMRAHKALADFRLYAEGSFGGEWYPDFKPRAGDIVCYEHWGMGGFAHTDLDLLLRQHGIRNVVIIGMTAPGCVEATGRQAMELGFSVTLVKDATAAYTFELMHCAHELSGPLYAESILNTSELIEQFDLIQTRER